MDPLSQQLRHLAQHTARLLWSAPLAARDPGLLASRAALSAWREKVPALGPLCETLDELANASPHEAARGLLRLQALLTQWEAARLTLAQSEGELVPLESAPPLYTRAPGFVVRAVAAGLRGKGEYARGAALDLAEGRSVTRDLRLLSAWGEAAGEAWFAPEPRARVFAGLGPPGLARLRASFDPRGGAGDAQRLETLCALLPPEQAASLAEWAMREGSGEVRAVALARWSERDPGAAGKFAFGVARDEETPAALRIAATTLLRFAPTEEALAWLLWVLDEESAPMKRAAAYALRGFGGLGAGDEVVSRLDSKHPALLTDALLRAIAGPLSEGAGVRLVELWWREYRRGPHRQAAEEALGRAAGSEALRMFAAYLPESTRAERLRQLLQPRLSAEPSLALLWEVSTD
jgi:hypothetical protein